MGIEKLFKRPIAKFIILTNLIFLPLFSLVGVTMMLKLPAIVSDIMLCIASWSSTFTFLILFKRLYPDQKIVEFLKDKFKTKIKLSIIMIAIIVQVLIFISVTFIIGFKSGGIGSVFTVSSVGIFIYLFLKHLFAGPLGEELGWRGFMQTELQKTHSPLIAAIIVGFWWGLWHLPIWFTTGFVGIDLIKYMVFFMIVVISLSIIMAAFYNLNKNLVVPIIIHQLFNFFTGLINGNLLDIIMYLAILYFIVASILVVINPKKVLY